MGLYTRKQYEALAETAFSERPSLPPAAPVEMRRVRMFHPDTTDRHPVRDFSFWMGGRELKVCKGIVEAFPEEASLLEERGWRRGKTIELEWT